MLMLFIAVHGVYFALGVRFDDTSLTWFWQYLDVALLKGHLAESLLYLHSQPPLFNLFLGVVLKLFPGHYATAFQAVFLAMGIGLYASLFLVMRRLGISSWLGLILSTLFMASPSFVLYEEWLCSTLPVTLALVLSVLFLQSFVERGRGASALGFFLCLLFLCGTWALFHLAYLGVVTGGLVVLLPRKRSILLKAAIPVACLVVALYAKNLVLFGHFAPSTWLGMNVARVTLQRASRAERTQLVTAGKISRIALMRPFQPIEAYPTQYGQVRGFESVPSLREVTKSTGAPNLNHLGYVTLSEQYLEDSLALAWNRPAAYARGVRAAWLYYFTSTSAPGHLTSNIERLDLPARLWDRFLYGRLSFEVPVDWNNRRPLHVTLLIGLPLVLLVSLRLALGHPAGGAGLPHEQRLLVGYMCFNILWVALVGNSIEVGENNRFRFTTDPLSIVLAGLVVQRLLRRWRRTSGARRPGAAASGTARLRGGVSAHGSVTAADLDGWDGRWVAPALADGSRSA